LKQFRVKSFKEMSENKQRQWEREAGGFEENPGESCYLEGPNLEVAKRECQCCL
jgi:hypothetical protein